MSLAEGKFKDERDRSPVKVKDDKQPGGEQNGSRPRPRRDARDSRDSRDRRPRDTRGPGDRRNRPDRRVYVSNIPFDYPWQELKDLFRNEVGSVKFVEIFHDESGSSRGCGIIEFDSDELVDLAIEKMHRYELKGRNIVVKEDFGVERDRCGRIVRGGDGAHSDVQRRAAAQQDVRRPSLMGSYRDSEREGRGGPGPSPLVPPEQKYANTFGLNISFLDSLGIEGPLVNRVFVANLDYTVDSNKLKEVFGLAGKVVSVEINKDFEGNSKGHGVVTFDHPVEAVQAISMLNGQTYMERRINVRMDRVAERRDRDQKVSLPTGLKGIGHGLGANGLPLNDVASKIQETPAPAPAAPAVPSQLAGLGQLAGGLMGAAPAAAATGFGAGMADVAAQLSAGGQLGHLAGAAGVQQLGGRLGGLAGLQGLPMQQLQADAGAAGRLPGLVERADDLGRGLDAGLGGRGGLDAGLMGRGGLEGLGGGRGLDAISRAGLLDSTLGGRGLLDSGRGGMDSGMRGGMDAARAGGRAPFSSGGGFGAGMGGDTGYGGAGSRNISDSIIVSNLDPGYTWQALRDQFRSVGDVRFADMKGKGVGVVRFASAQEAQRAISLMDGQRMDGRVLDVRAY